MGLNLNIHNYLNAAGLLSKLPLTKDGPYKNQHTERHKNTYQRSLLLPKRTPVESQNVPVSKSQNVYMA